MLIEGLPVSARSRKKIFFNLSRVAPLGAMHFTLDKLKGFFHCVDIFISLVLMIFFRLNYTCALAYLNFGLRVCLCFNRDFKRACPLRGVRRQKPLVLRLWGMKCPRALEITGSAGGRALPSPKKTVKRRVPVRYIRGGRK